jgi:hypothetical protein
MTNVPSQCHLWQRTDLTLEGVAADLEIVETFESESHLSKHAMRCGQCGQLYFHMWCELTDWDEGDDQMYDVYVPVPDRAEIDRLRTIEPPPASFDILEVVPRLQSDRSFTLRWVGKE